MHTKKLLLLSKRFLGAINLIENCCTMLRCHNVNEVATENCLKRNSALRLLWTEHKSENASKIFRKWAKFNNKNQ